MSTIRLLHTEPLGGINQLAVPEKDQTVSLTSPATEVFTDFLIHRPLVIDGDLSVYEVEQHMKRAHVKLKLVVDHSGAFLGMVSYRDLEGERFQRLVGKGVAPADIMVEQVMTPRAELRAVRYGDIERATIGDVVETLRTEHCQHFIVVDPDRQHIRGVFSASDLARRLRIPIEISRAPTFADICHAVFEHLSPTH